VYIDVENREKERKKQGLPPRVGIVPHSVVAAEEEPWEARPDRRKKRTRRRNRTIMTKIGKVVWLGSTP